MKHDNRILLRALLPGVPALAVIAVLLWRSDIQGALRWALLVGVALGWIVGAISVQTHVLRPLQMLANMIAALREGDYSIRAGTARARPDDAFGLALLEINQLATALRDHRLSEREASAFLRIVMAEIDVAVFAFDEAEALQLVNRAGERILGEAGERLVGRAASALGLAPLLAGEVPRVDDLGLPGGQGRWGVRRTTVRQNGRAHTVLVLTDLSRTLREEQLTAWQRIVRVLGHEINNSLAPIQSIAHTLRGLLARDPAPADMRSDVARGLEVIAARSEGLSRFMSSYARLARLPAPRMGAVDVAIWLERTAALEPRLSVRVRDGPPIEILGDGDQLDQVLINLIRNAADAVLEDPATHGTVDVGWDARDGHVEVAIEDTGPGLPATGNLFVPFFTTKPNGSGIGLLLSRQIIEAHGGTLTIANQSAGRGCRAVIRLPLMP